MSEKTVLYEREGGVARITLNRPDRLNAWNAEFADDLRDALSTAESDDAARCVLITGAGRGFSAGADLKEAGESAAQGNGGGGEGDVGDLLRRRYNPIILSIRTMPKPVVAAVNGPAVGIGCSLALACDMIVAAESAVLGLAFVRIGLMPDGGASLFVPVAAGKARAFELTMLGDPIDARQAEEWGLVNRTVKDAELQQEAMQLAGRLAGGPSQALASAKKALNKVLYSNLEEQLELEADLQAELLVSPDFLEGVTAFLEKRTPAFTGA